MLDTCPSDERSPSPRLVETASLATVGGGRVQHHHTDTHTLRLSSNAARFFEESCGWNRGNMTETPIMNKRCRRMSRAERRGPQAPDATSSSTAWLRIRRVLWSRDAPSCRCQLPNSQRFCSLSHHEIFTAERVSCLLFRSSLDISESFTRLNLHTEKSPVRRMADRPAAGPGPNNRPSSGSGWSSTQTR